MAINIVNITPLVKLFHSMFVASTSTVSSAKTLANSIMDAKPRLAGGTISYTLLGEAVTFTPSTIYGHKTMDGAIVTDMDVALRHCLSTIAAPALGRRMEKDPVALAEYIQSVVIKFFQGGALGGAIYDTGKWSISPHWVPIETPTPLEVLSGSIEDPAVRLLNLLSLVKIEGEDSRKAASCAVDPFYSLLAIGGQTVVTVDPAPVVSDAFWDGWKPQLVHAGGDATDVLTRASTMVPNDDSDNVWETSAYDELFTSGSVMTMLQAPRVFCYTGMLSRLVYDAGSWWFCAGEKDYAITGLNVDQVNFVKNNQFAMKRAWLDTIRGLTVRERSRMTAFAGSPLACALTDVSYQLDATGQVFETLPITDAIRVYVASDPEAPASIKSVVDAGRAYLAQAWLPESTDAYFTKLKGVK